MASVDTSNKRRRFQHLDIATYLLPNENAPYSGIPALSPSGLLSPSLPHEVQVSLMQVGMRIRKSINDGYKTTKKSFLAPIVISTSNPASESTPRSPRSTPYISTTYSLSSPSSQESLSARTSTDMVPPSNRKRGLSSCSNYSIYNDSSPAHTPIAMDMSPPLRPIAQAKSRRRKVFTTNGCGLSDYDPMKIDDFGEADFLKPLDDSERAVWYD